MRHDPRNLILLGLLSACFAATISAVQAEPVGDMDNDSVAYLCQKKGGSYVETADSHSCTFPNGDVLYCQNGDNHCVYNLPLSTPPAKTVPKIPSLKDAPRSN